MQQPKDGFISVPHWSDHGDGPFLHMDQYADGRKIDHVPVQNPLGAFAIGGAIAAERRNR